jgi:hypothetical protein
MDTQTQIDRLIELAIIQRTELKQLVEQLPQLREHLNAEVERTFEEAEPQIRTELEEFVTRQASDKTATLGVALEAKIGELAKSLEESAQAKYSALIATRDQNAALLAQAEERIAAASAELPAKVKDIVAAELARFPRAGEIDQLRKEFAEPKSLNPRGKWQSSESYNKLDLVTINGDSYTSNIDGNRTRPSRSSADWTLVAARGTGGGGGPTSLSELTTVPSNGDLLIGSGTSWVTSNLTAGAGISITVGAGEITISATDGDITLDDGTAASPSLHFTNDADTGLYRPADNTLGISVSGTQVAYFDTDGLTIPSAGVVAGGSFHGANGNANNPTFSFESDQDTGMYRHGTNELGFTIGGTEKAVMTSTTFTVTPNLVVSGTGSINGTSIPASKTLVVTTDKLSALASTSSSELAGVISDETGTGSLVFANTPTLVTPNIGAATGTSVNLSGSGAFGGNLTVSGTGGVILNATDAILKTTDSVSKRPTILAGVTESAGVYTAQSATPVLAKAAGDVGVYVIYADSGKTVGNTYTPTSQLTVSSTATTLAGNLTVSGTGGIQLNSVANLTWGGSYGAGIPTIAIPSATSIGFYPTGSTSGKTFELFGTGNATLSGNLTVSGTGTHTFGTTNTVTMAAGVLVTLSSANYTSFGTGFASKIETFAHNYNLLTGLASSGAVIQSRNGLSAGVLQLNPDGGNLLVGTAIDGGQKLQVNGTAAIAGGIWSTSYTSLPSDSTSRAILGVSGGVAYLQSATGQTTNALSIDGSSVTIRTGTYTTALTLDSSQNATFAGDIKFSLANSFDVGETGTRVRNVFVKNLIVTSGPPASASAAGTTGTINWDADYIYVCTATNTWKRVAIATW